MTEVRPLHPGMGQAVAERTVLRPRLASGHGPSVRVSPADPHYFDWMRAAHFAGVHLVEDLSALPAGKPPVEYESWGEVAERVAIGNTAVHPETGLRDRDGLRAHIAKATILLSGRHLQHGDADQPSRPLEVFSNCSTAPTSFFVFYLLLNGSGVGRDYSDDMVLTNFDYAPTLICVLDESHKDFRWGQHASVRDARHLYGKGNSVRWFTVPDSREGWAKAVEVYEVMAFEKVHANRTLVLDFSEVRPSGSAIRGMQMRPASGPGPLMDALSKVAMVKGAGLRPWLQALYIDHFMAECVLVGGARRSARMSTKSWRDPDVLDFIEVKRPIEYEGLTCEEVMALRADWKGRFLRGEVFSPNPPSFLWSSNNSVTADEEFWALVRDPVAKCPLHAHAHAVFQRLTECAYYDGTGEPGIVNVDRLVTNREGWDYQAIEFAASDRYTPDMATRVYLSLLAQAAHGKRHPMIVNPCGEVALTTLGGYCTISDVVPYHADTLDEAEDAFRHAVRALMRVNTMDCLYHAEVRRTNRIGVGMTGVHEYAWKFFQTGFRDLVSVTVQDVRKLASDAAVRIRTADSLPVIKELQGSSFPRERAAGFWLSLAQFSRAVKDEAARYADELGAVRPHTDTTTKPAGTTSKLFGLSEGWHLPPLAEYIRWVQFKEDDPLVSEYEAKGYPIRKDLKSYRGMTIVGFPTVPTIATLGLGEKMVLAGDATPTEQYHWLMMGEHFYIRGVDELLQPLPDTGNQISYTLKYKPGVVTYEEFCGTMRQHQSQIRACSVMPQEDGSAYEYLPEEGVTKAEFERMARAIERGNAVGEMTEDIGLEHISCESGACPVDFNESK